METEEQKYTITEIIAVMIKCKWLYEDNANEIIAAITKSLAKDSDPEYAEFLRLKAKYENSEP